jgi:hypothetical protein
VSSAFTQTSKASRDDPVNLRGKPETRMSRADFDMLHMGAEPVDAGLPGHHPVLFRINGCHLNS